MAKKKLHQLTADLAEKVKSFNAAIPSMTAAETAKKRKTIITARAKVQEALTEGAKPCPECNNRPIGIQQPSYFEIGCLSFTSDCPGRHSKGHSVEHAVENWNSKIYYTS